MNGIRPDPRVYRRIIEKLVYPPPEALGVELVETEPGKGILAISVPRQPPELRPLLVLGAIAGDKVLGSHVSIVRRRDDATQDTDPAAIHSLLAAGRAALGGAPPTQSPGPAVPPASSSLAGGTPSRAS